VLTAALAATFAVFFLTSLRIATRARDVEVPDLRGRSMAEANAVLADRGLLMHVDEARRADPDVPLDHVLTQEPEPGTVIRRQRAVRVRLSDGSRAPVVPTVAELPERTAELTLAADQIAVGYRAEIRSADYPPGTVVAQDPPPTRRAATINLLVNRADTAKSWVVPDVIGSLAIRTLDVLRTQGFRVTISAEVSYPGLPPGVVVRQMPQPGFPIGSGETLSIEVTR
jgi:serine/threonine-protein kinase